jgi:hypothetical protein
MKIISFAWTTKVLLAGKKTMTRRFWDDNYAKRFKKGGLVLAYDKSPRKGGKRVAVIQLTRDPYKQHLDEMTDEDEKKEGGLWSSAMAFVAVISQYGSEPWVIEFKVVNN